MDPISIAIELELATLILAGVGTFATWLHHKHSQHVRQDCERRHQEVKAQHERHHAERMKVMGAPMELIEEIDVDTTR